MLWKEFVADRILKREDISEWLSTFFGIPSEAILVLPEKEVFRIDDPMGDEIWVLCETTEREGEFVMQVDVFTRRPELDVLDPHPAIVQLCRTLGVRVVQPND